MDITLYILIGFLCFIFGLIVSGIVVYRVFEKEDDKRYDLLDEMNKGWSDHCLRLIHDFYDEKLKELDEEMEKEDEKTTL